MQPTKYGLVTSSSPPSRRRRHRALRKESTARSILPIIPGYTVLVVDTNILLSSLSRIASVIESLRWTVIILVPIVMELNGLSSNSSQLGEASQATMSYISSRIRSHSASLKVQTSKGNSLGIYTEQVDFQDEAFWEWNVDDVTLFLNLTRIGPARPVFSSSTEPTLELIYLWYRLFHFDITRNAVYEHLF